VGSQDWRKSEGVVRIAFQNINSLGFDKERKKDMLLYTFLKDWEVDFGGIAETNICWQKMGHKQQFWDRTKGWFDNRSVNYANNVNEPLISTRGQPGGVASLAIDRLATKVDTSGRDPSGLGRWIWTRFVGKKWENVAGVYGISAMHYHGWKIMLCPTCSSLCKQYRRL
jgi:hypothetical protein